MDAFTIMRIAGHSSIMVSHRYEHPLSEAVEGAFELLQGQTTRKRASKRKPAKSGAKHRPLPAKSQDETVVPNVPKMLPPATIVATVEQARSVSC